MEKWWRERVFYEVWPRSFCDSNGDGIGDLKGLESRLDYLAWLGVGAIWLCPVYDSPNDDMGYDIRDYDSIGSDFGTMEDFESLVRGVHERGMKLVMDLVVNHTSDEHKWFVESRRSKDSPYRDYYIWADGKDGREPNNWASIFTPSAWTLDEGTGQYYLHLFGEKQPDLNWGNPHVRSEVRAMMNRWFDKGVDGFRMDVVSLLAKAPGLPDAEGEGYVFPAAQTAFQPALHTYLREMRAECFDGSDRMCVGETPFVNTSNASSVLHDGRELDLLFQFDLMDIDGEGCKWNTIPLDLPRLKRAIASWQKAVDWNTLFWGNHDQPRIVSRFGSDATEALRIQSAKMLAVAMYLQKGTPFLYQGEEIGMTNFPFERPDQLRDIESLNLLREAAKDGREAWAWEGILRKGRDNARTPVQWSASENAGFTTGEPWIGVNPNHKRINVRAAFEDKGSILHFYRRLLALRRKTPALLRGGFEMLLPDDRSLLAFRRSLPGQSVVVCCNFTGADVPFEAPKGRILEGAAENGKLGPYGFVVVEEER